jgi:molecular chaperone DnaK
VLQGERDMSADNKTLGRFILDGIPPAPRGVPQIEVSFDIDANGILSVSAKDKASGKQQKITIQASTGLSKDEVERMKKDAELHAEEDKKKREHIELKNNADSMVYTTEKMLKENGEKISADKKKAIEEKLAALKAVKDGEDDAAIKRAADELGTAAQAAGAEMYEADKASPSAEASGDKPSDEGKKDGNGPIDAEFTEKKEEGKE